MTQDGAKKESKSEYVNRQALTFREFVHRQEENKDTPVSAPAPVPLIDLVDLILVGAMLFIFISMLLIFVY